MSICWKLPLHVYIYIDHQSTEKKEGLCKMIFVDDKLIVIPVYILTLPFWNKCYGILKAGGPCKRGWLGRGEVKGSRLTGKRRGRGGPGWRGRGEVEGVLTDQWQNHPHSWHFSLRGRLLEQLTSKKDLLSTFIHCGALLSMGPQ